MNMTANSSAVHDRQTWMKNVLDIDKLKLTDVVWPGVHNCGMDKKAPSHGAVIGHWASYQNDTFAWQLANGARAFDIRLGYTAGTDQPQFYFHHNGNRSGRLLEDLIDAVLPFLDRNPNEFIVLDFHQLGDGDQPFDHKKLNDLLVRRLGMRAIPPADGFRTIAQLKRSSPRRRIVMAAPFIRELDIEYFWSRIPHKWQGDTFTSTSDLRRHIEATLKGAPGDAFFWSLPATSHALFAGPQNIKEQINDWFHTTRDWVTRCSIINTDFFEESDIVRYCWSASSMKALRGSALHAAVPAR
jgi:1-phosphatidylinositol phosphodiesterase